MTEPHLPRLGVVVHGKYRLDSVTGQDAVVTVFAATQLPLNQPCVIKWLLPKFARDQDSVRRFLTEAKSAALISHPNVVSPLDVSTDPQAPYFATEPLHGQTLDEYLTGQPLAVETVGHLFVPILQGVAAAHDQHLVHGELRPKNIILTHDTDRNVVPRVLDFGSARLTDRLQTQATVTDQSAILDAIQYLSPEQLQDSNHVGRQTDVYALGMIAYRMFAGKLPYSGNLMDLALRIRDGRPTPLRTHIKSMPEGLEAVVMRAMSPALGERYADVHAFANALAPFFSRHGVAFGSAQRPSERSPISDAAKRVATPAHVPTSETPRAPTERPSASASSQSRGSDAGELDELSTFNPVTVGSSFLPPTQPRVWLLLGAAGLAAIAVVLAFIAVRYNRADAHLRSAASGTRVGHAPNAKTPPPIELRAVPPPKSPALEPSPQDAEGWRDLSVSAPSAPAGEAAEPAPPIPPPAEAALSPTPSPADPSEASLPATIPAESSPTLRPHRTRRRPPLSHPEGPLAEPQATELGF